MTAIELERKIDDMRIQFAKENWNGNTNDDMSEEDWLSVYALMRTKEYYNKFKEREIK